MGKKRLCKLSRSKLLEQSTRMAREFGYEVERVSKYLLFTKLSRHRTIKGKVWIAFDIELFAVYSRLRHYKRGMTTLRRTISRMTHLHKVLKYPRHHFSKSHQIETKYLSKNGYKNFIKKINSLRKNQNIMAENKIQLMSYAGGDNTHCLSAWQSTSDELGIDLPDSIEHRVDVIFAYLAKQKKKTPEQLLGFLAEHGHTTPFENSFLYFQCASDIATHIHCLKHRIGVTINTESARYKELKDKFYVPVDWKDTKIGEDAKKQLIERLPEPIGKLFWPLESWAKVIDAFNEIAATLYHISAEDLTKQLGRKRAKETSRYFLPYSKQLNYSVTVNFRSLVHFLKLRHSKHAQREVAAIAAQMLEQLKSIEGEPFKHSLAAFGY